MIEGRDHLINETTFRDRGRIIWRYLLGMSSSLAGPDVLLNQFSFIRIRFVQASLTRPHQGRPPYLYLDSSLLRIADGGNVSQIRTRPRQSKKKSGESL